MSDNISIKVNSVSKTFKLPHEKQGSLKSLIVNFWRRDKGYEIQKVLQGVSFEIRKGEFFGIVGRNGSGKSTLLKILSGIYTPTEGSVQVNGRLTPFIELGVGFSPDLTGRENIFLNGSLLGFTRKQMEAMYKDIVDFAELDRFMDQKLKNYSSGMQVRLAFSIAIRAESDILVLDEVLAVGDEAFQKKCYDYFYSLKRNKKTVVIVTHDMAAVENFCTRAMLIEGGEIIKEGDPRLVAQSYKELFESDSGNLPKGAIKENSKRWGSKQLLIKKVQPEVGVKIISLRLDIESREAVKDKIEIAYTVKSADGENLFGNVFKLKTNKKKEGIIPVTISFSNILSNGNYYVDINIRNLKSGIYCDFWIDCATFSIKNTEENPLHILTNSKIITH